MGKMVNSTIIILELEKIVWSPIWTKPTLGILFGRSHIIWSPIIAIFSLWCEEVEAVDQLWWWFVGGEAGRIGEWW
jgi:hypothetical protein